MVERQDCSTRAHRRNRVGGAHAGQTQRLVGRPELPDGLQLCRSQGRCAAQPQRFVGAVEYQRGACRAFIGQFTQTGLRRAKRAGGLTSPKQLGLARIGHHCQPMRARGLRIVSVAVRRQPDGASALPRCQRCRAKNELTGAGRQQHALHFHTVKSGQLLAQRAIARVRILAGVGLSHGGKRSRAGPAGIAVGGEVVQRYAVVVGAAVNAFDAETIGTQKKNAQNAIRIIANSAHKTRSTSAFNANFCADEISEASASRPSGLSV